MRRDTSTSANGTRVVESGNGWYGLGGAGLSSGKPAKPRLFYRPSHGRNRVHPGSLCLSLYRLANRALIVKASSASSTEQSGVRSSSVMRPQPIGKPRPQRLCFESSKDGGHVAFLNAPLRTGLSDRLHSQWFSLPGTNFPDEPEIVAACRVRNSPRAHPPCWLEAKEKSKR